MGIKDFFLKKAVQSQLKNVPEEQREIIMKLVEENPELFTNIAKEVQDLTKSGMNQMTAMMQVMKKYQKELQDILGKQEGGRPF